MKGLEIKFSEVGITTSANPQRKAMYFVVANVIDDKGGKAKCDCPPAARAIDPWKHFIFDPIKVLAGGVIFILSLL